MPMPYALRIQAKWEQFRSVIIPHFPKAPGLPKSSKSYLRSVSEVYAQDAYNSLSIEGYQVTPDLIEKVKAAKWHPERDPHDKQLRDTLAARGYYEAFQAVKASVEQVFKGGAASGCTCGVGTFHFCLHSPLHGWQWTLRSLFDERDARFRRLSLDGG